MPDELLLRGQTQPSRRRPRSDDQCASLHPVLIHVQPEGALGKVRIEQIAVHVLCAKILRLLLYALDQNGSIDPFRKAGEVLDQRGERQLAPGMESRSR